MVGAELFLDTMYVGKLKGAGPVWQFAAIDGACSFALAQAVAGEKRQEQAIAFLVERVLPICAEAGIELGEAVQVRRAGRQVAVADAALLQRRPEGASNSAPRSLATCASGCTGRSCTSTTASPSVSATTASAADVDADLQGFMRHYNFGPPHRGRRPQGATPASRFYAHAPSSSPRKDGDRHGHRNVRQDRGPHDLGAAISAGAARCGALRRIASFDAGKTEAGG